jgi:hypothetical protein
MLFLDLVCAEEAPCSSAPRFPWRGSTS